MQKELEHLYSKDTNERNCLQFSNHIQKQPLNFIVIRLPHLRHEVTPFLIMIND